MDKLSVGAVIRKPGNISESNMSGWRSQMPVIEKQGTCLERAQLNCPDGAIFKKDGKFKINYQYCKGCGICAKLCPNNIKMVGVKK